MGAFDGLSADMASAFAEAGVNGSLTYTKATQGAYDASTSTGTSSPNTKALAATIGACKRELRQDIGVQAGDLKVTVMAAVWSASFTGDPETDDTVSHRSQSYLVVAVAPSEIGGALVSYSIQLRRT